MRSLVAECVLMGFGGIDFPLHRPTAREKRGQDPCYGCLGHLGRGQRQESVPVPADSRRLQRHDHFRVDRTGTEAGKPMSQTVMSSEEGQLKLTQYTQDEIEGALGEIQRERMVRERCFPRWVAEGKISRIDAKDRLARQQLSEEIMQIVLDIVTPPAAQ
jgi:hypothetical protein